MISPIFHHSDCLRAAIYGFAVGDALGVPYEFQPRGSFTCTNMTGYGTHNQPAGTWSDDTAMMLATLDSLATHDDVVDVEDMRARYTRWMRDGEYAIDELVFDIGITVRTALRTGQGRTEASSCGNGSLMRILPLAFTSAPDETVRQVSAITHAHPICQDHCVTYVHLIRRLLNRETLPPFPTPRDRVASTGYVVDTLNSVRWALANGSDYRSTVLAAVNLGGDTDTICALAGGAAAIRYGWESIPEDWVSMLRGRDIIDTVLEHATDPAPRAPVDMTQEPPPDRGIIRRLMAHLTHCYPRS